MMGSIIPQLIITLFTLFGPSRRLGWTEPLSQLIINQQGFVSHCSCCFEGLRKDELDESGEAACCAFVMSQENCVRLFGVEPPSEVCKGHHHKGHNEDQQQRTSGEWLHVQSPKKGKIGKVKQTYGTDPQSNIGPNMSTSDIFKHPHVELESLCITV